MTETEYAVVGGGLVGMAVAYGLVRLGRSVAVFDEGDRAFRASRGNFGLVWVQGKGAALPEYAGWTRLSARLWPEFAAELEETTGVPLELKQPGGLHFCLDENELEARVTLLEELRAALGGDYPFERLGHNAVKELVPEIGPEVVGATYGPEDGHANPLGLLQALHAAFQGLGGRLVNGASVARIAPAGDGFRLWNGAERRVEKLVLCAGLGNALLAPMVGLEAPVRPQRGQVLICERMRPFLRLPTHLVRQVGTGAVQIGDSKEEVGFDDGTTPQVAAAIARRAVRMFPLLANARVVRSWGALRVMSPDSCPFYDRSPEQPGACVVNCHSGVTLAAAHALALAPWIAGGARPKETEKLSAKRFALRPAA